ncbi:MAG: hypothetical protein RR585_01960 [Coprobacillus sp.]
MENPYVKRVDELVETHQRVGDIYCTQIGKYSFQRYVQFSNKLYAHINMLGQKSIEWSIKNDLY